MAGNAIYHRKVVDKYIRLCLPATFCVCLDMLPAEWDANCFKAEYPGIADYCDSRTLKLYNLQDITLLKNRNCYNLGKKSGM